MPLLRMPIMKAPLKIFDDGEAEATSVRSGKGVQHIQPDRAQAAERERCVDCGLEAPPTETAYTLISARHRWRLLKVVDASGLTVVEWRCANCWARYRARTTPSS